MIFENIIQTSIFFIRQVQLCHLKKNEIMSLYASSKNGRDTPPFYSFYPQRLLLSNVQIILLGKNSNKKHKILISQFICDDLFKYVILCTNMYICYVS